VLQANQRKNQIKRICGKASQVRLFVQNQSNIGLVSQYDAGSLQHRIGNIERGDFQGAVAPGSGQSADTAAEIQDMGERQPHARGSHQGVAVMRNVPFSGLKEFLDAPTAAAPGLMTNDRPKWIILAESLPRAL
jgi:hypothetical protein